ncbi:Chaperone protein dnaK [Corynebacterium diphtheriae BH8]|uniref:hypothetical protein n=1 Tax=Corynebacterium diphtheriae TaxID=1717 RepID=UPI000245BACD|nr:hypothetical protein [Corynebacterium diphtheriae]AEX47739.1 Chaperone protein dnaK [Corynebacterium diphtheriae BH8]CAB0983269.1 hypothetical protein FRC0508_00355 [Corynebacterium diphtheriae]
MSKKNFARVSAIALTLPIIATATFIPNSNATDSKEEGGTRRAFAFENPAHTSPVEEENSNLEPNKSGYTIEQEDFDEDEVSYDYSKIKEGDWDNSSKINPAYSDGSDFEYNSDNYVFDAYIDGYDDEESELNKMVRNLKQLQQKKKQEQLNYENSAESAALVAQQTAELDSKAEAESATPVTQPTTELGSKAEAESATPVTQPTTELDSKAEAELTTPVTQQTAELDSNVLANRYNAIQTPTGTGKEGSVLNNRYKAYLKSKTEAKSATLVAQPTADTVSHNWSSDTSEN